MSKNFKAYPSHACPLCGIETTMKSYCLPCLREVTRPQYSLKSDPGIIADRQRRVGRRNETVGVLR